MSFVYRVLEHVLTRILPPKDSNRILVDIEHLEPFQQLQHALDGTKISFKTSYLRSIIRTAREREAMMLTERYRLMSRLDLFTCRMNTGWLIVFFAFASSNSFMLPDVYKIDAWSVYITIGLISVVLFTHKGNFKWRSLR